MARRRAMQPPVDDPTPFRWDVAKRNQLGTLADISTQALNEWLADRISGSHGAWKVLTRRVDPVDWFIRELVMAIARIVAVSDDSDLFFIGRSLETVHDCLRGVFADSKELRRFHLVPFSMRYSEDVESVTASPRKIGRLRRHLESLSLSPSAIIGRNRATGLIDVVVSGDTLGHLVLFLHHWSSESRTDWRQLRIAGLTERTKTSPKTWRWQQHAAWVKLLNKSAVKNV